MSVDVVVFVTTGINNLLMMDAFSSTWGHKLLSRRLIDTDFLGFLNFF